MKTTKAAFRGQPLVLLILLLGGWALLRAAFWETPFAPIADLGRSIIAPLSAAPVPGEVGPPPIVSGDRRAPASSSYPTGRQMALRRTAVPPIPGGRRETASAALLIGPRQPPTAGLAAIGTLPAGAAAVQPNAPAYPSGILPHRPEKPRGRLSAEGWLLARSGGGGGDSGALRPGYGRSQAGVALRYRLGADSVHRPQLHIRASAALAGGQEREIASGLSVRPFPVVPIRGTAELRVTRLDNGDTNLRPAAFVVTEMTPLDLPLATRGEIYLQAGYVGGNYATGFLDGQARVERSFARLGDAQLSAGTVAWGGAQRGAGRLDLGPSAALNFPLGDGYARLSVDYRIRVAGDAAPASGPALALSAGF